MNKEATVGIWIAALALVVIAGSFAYTTFFEEPTLAASVDELRTDMNRQMILLRQPLCDLTAVTASSNRDMFATRPWCLLGLSVAFADVDDPDWEARYGFGGGSPAPSGGG